LRPHPGDVITATSPRGLAARFTGDGGTHILPRFSLDCTAQRRADVTLQYPRGYSHSNTSQRWRSFMKVIIVGAVAAGMSAATRLRRLVESAEIVVLEAGEHVSFANCGLPYYVGGVIEERDALLLQTPESL